MRPVFRCQRCGAKVGILSDAVVMGSVLTLFTQFGIKACGIYDETLVDSLADYVNFILYLHLKHQSFSLNLHELNLGDNL